MIEHIELLNFKKHLKSSFKFEKKIVIFHGINGSGKTSILEAISLFTAGKGIFNLQNEQLIYQQADFFMVKMQMQSHKCKIIFKDKKEIYLNQALTKPKLLLDIITILGLTPYTTLAFWQNSALRRKIIDRIVLQHDPTYGEVYMNYLKALKQRNTLITNTTFNSKWKHILDPQLKKDGLKINASREKLFKDLFQNITEEIQDFLQDKITLNISPTYSEQKNILSNDLPLSFIGPHASKYELTNGDHILPSVGQQRKLLLAFLLISLKQEHKAKILLLDDILCNLDKNTTIQFLNLLHNMQIQTFITNIDAIAHPHVQNIKVDM